jgi:uncharacterized protein
VKEIHKELIIDSGFLIALLNKNDHFHRKAFKLIKLLPNKKWVSTWAVVTEVSYMLVKERLFVELQRLLNLCENGGLTLFHIDTHHISRLKQLMEKYRNLPMDLADGSLVLLAEELGHGDIVSTDNRDFETYRWKNHKPFSNLFS